MSRNRRVRVRVFVWAVGLATAALGGLFSPAASLAYAEGQDEADHVYFVLAIDAVSGFAPDRANLCGTLEAAFKEQGIDPGRYSFRIFEAKKIAGYPWDTSNDMTDDAVLDYVRDLRPQPNDTIVFYYTGSGGFYAEKGHILELRRWNRDGKPYKTELYRKDVLGAMARVPHRASIVLTDCCAIWLGAGVNDPLGATEKQTPDPAVEFLLARKGHGEVVRDLFFRPRGIVNITGSRTGSMSCFAPLPAAEGGGSKGHFTTALCNLLKVDRGAFHAGQDRAVGWDEFFPKLQNLTQVQSYNFNNGTKCQTPEMFMVGPARSGVGQTPPRNPILSKDEELTPQDRALAQPLAGQSPGGTRFYHKFYPLPMSRAKAYWISLNSVAFHTFLYVADEQLKSLLTWNHDDDSSTTRSRILFFPPADGQFVVGVTSFKGEGTGRFSLTVEEATFADQLAATDPLDRFCSGSFSKVHPVQLAAFRTYTIRLISPNTRELDPFLRIEDEFGDTMALNDDEEPLKNLNSMVTFRTQAAGTYYIVATSCEPRKTGRYAVFVQE